MYLHLVDRISGESASGGSAQGVPAQGGVYLGDLHPGEEVCLEGFTFGGLPKGSACKGTPWGSVSGFCLGRAASREVSARGGVCLYGEGCAQGVYIQRGLHNPPGLPTRGSAYMGDLPRGSASGAVAHPLGLPTGYRGVG